MKKLIFIPVIGLCLILIYFFASAILYGLLFNDGHVTIDFNSLNEGWAEFGLVLLLAITGTVFLCLNFRKYMLDFNAYDLSRNKVTQAVVISLAACCGVLLVLGFLTYFSR